ncbi:class I SAM-dependent methyltransferase [Parasphingorhabdus pacifica]
MEAVPEGVVSYWNGRARNGYDLQPGQDAAREGWALRVGPLIAEAVGRGARVLDSGCGTGFLARLLAVEGCHVTGQDLSPGMLQVATERAVDEDLAVEWLVGSAEEPPSGPFDAVVLRNVLWTLPDPGAALRALREVLRPGGLVLISDAQWGAADVGDEVVEERFNSCYAGAVDALPFAAGVDFAECAALVRQAGFGEVIEHTSLFAEAPYPSAPGFFLMTARVSGEREDVLVAADQGAGHQKI